MGTTNQLVKKPRVYAKKKTNVPAEILNALKPFVQTPEKYKEPVDVWR